MFPHLPFKTLPTPATLSDALAEIARMRPVYLAARSLATDAEHVATYYRESVVGVVSALTAAENVLP